MTGVRKFRMGKLDHVHIRVPDRTDGGPLGIYAAHSTSQGRSDPR